MMTSRETFVFDDGSWQPQTSGGIVARVRVDSKTQDDLLATLAEQLHFPGYFGKNWDALEECLLDLLPNQGRSVTIWHESLPDGLDGKQLHVYLSVLQFVGAERARRGDPPLVAVFPADARSAIVNSLMNQAE